MTSWWRISLRQRLLAVEAHGPPGFEDGAIDFGEIGKSLPMRGGFELRHCDQFLLQAVFEDLALLDQNVFFALDELVELGYGRRGRAPRHN